MWISVRRECGVGGREFRRSESSLPGVEAASLDNRAGMPFEGGTNM